MGGKHDMKILFITSDKYPPYRPAAKLIFGRELPMRGFTIDWLLPAQDEKVADREVVTEAGTVYVAATNDGRSLKARLMKHWMDLRNDLRAFSLARRNRYDIIQVKDKYLAALIGILVARLHGAKFVFWLAYPHPEASLYAVAKGVARYPLLYWIRGRFLKWLLYRVILPASDHAFVQSEQMRRDIAEHGIAPEKMTPVPGSVDLAEIPAAVPSAERGQGPTLLYLGTLIRERRLDFLVRVLRRVSDEHPGARLLFVGRGEMKEDEDSLYREAVRLGLEEAVVFTGHLPMQEAWEYVAQADVCLSPYFPTPILNSTSPTKLIEYMAMGKATVANDHPEQQLVIEESGAGICVAWDEEEFAEAVCRIVADPDMAAEMGRKGRRYVEKYRTNARLADVVEERYGALFQPISLGSEQPKRGW